MIIKPPELTLERAVEYVSVCQENEWWRLHEDIEEALNGTWSMGCQSTTSRLIESIRLVGPIGPEKVQWPLWAGGVYLAVLNLARVDYLWDTQAMLDAEKLVTECNPSLGTISSHAARYYDTIMAMKNDSQLRYEINWILAAEHGEEYDPDTDPAEEPRAEATPS